MTQLNIFIVSRFFYPDYAASSQMLTDIAHDFVRHDWNVTVLASRKLSTDPTRRLPRQEHLDGITIRRVWTTRFGRHRLPGRMIDYLSFYFSVFLALRRVVSKGAVVIADSDPPLLSVVVDRACRRPNAIVLHHVADLYPDLAGALGVLAPGGVLARFMTRWRNAAFRRGQATVVPGSEMKKRIVQSGVDPAIIHVIPYWADGQVIRPLEREANPLRSEWDVGDRFVVGYSGNMGRAHEFETLLGAAGALRDRDDIVFLLVGGGARLPALVHQVAERGLENIRFKPYQTRESLWATLTLPDVHLISLRPALEGMVMPSKYYGIAAAGRPTIFIGDPEGEIAGLIRKADSGVVIPIGEGNTLASILVDLARDHERRRGLGANARKDFEARFDKPVSLAIWRDLLTRLVNDCTPQRPA